MALQVWLPLNGDLKNKGCADVTVTNNGATVSNDGKIGKCYSFGNGNASSKGINIDNNFIDIGTSRSICAWVRPKGNHYHYSGAIVSSGNWNGKRWAFCLKQDNTGFTGFDQGFNSYYSTTIPVDTWTHLCVTVDGDVTKFYKNGVYLGQQSRGTTFQSDATNTMIGRETYAAGYFTFNGDINDVRIYDHCLSPAEVHEIAQGLVLHYKLNDVINPNLLPSKYWRNTTNGSKSSNEFINLFDAKEIWDTYGLVPYTVSFDAKSAIAKSFNLYGSYGTNNRYGFKSTSINITTEWQRFTYTFTPYSTNESGTWAGCSIYGTYGSGAIPSIRRVKLELGSVATPMNGNDIVTDSSGYNNNGTINGTLTLSTDSPRYDVSTGFNGTTYIQSESPSTEVRSVSLWVKWNSIPAGQSVVFIDQKSKIGFGLTSNGILCSSAGVTSTYYKKSLLSANTWYHFVIVNPNTSPTSTTRDLYINGVKQSLYSGASNWSYSLDALQLGKRSTTSDGFNGQIADFRIYATALSAEDIRQLYEVSAKIDKEKNLYCYEFSELGDSNTKIFKTGVFRTGEFNEIDGIIKIKKDKTVDSNQFIET